MTLEAAGIIKKSDGVVTHVVGLAGSLRAESATRMAVRYALTGAEEEVGQSRADGPRRVRLAFPRSREGRAWRKGRGEVPRAT